MHHALGEFRRSQAHGRHFLWTEVGLDPDRLHYSPSVLAYLREQAADGRRLVLASRSTQQMADAVAEHVGLFDDAIGAIPPEHLTGSRKAKRLTDAFGTAASTTPATRPPTSRCGRCHARRWCATHPRR